jgi:hypothetical protein
MMKMKKGDRAFFYRRYRRDHQGASSRPHRRAGHAVGLRRRQGGPGPAASGDARGDQGRAEAC